MPTDKIGHGISRVAASVSQKAHDAGSRLGAQLRNVTLPAVPEWKISTRALRRGLPALFVLAVMLAFLFSETGLHKTLETASANTKSGAAVTPAAAILPTPSLPTSAKPAVPDLANAPTHRKVTDPEIQSDLENMTRYELATARRAAQYGDDISALQLGMAYETGYDVTQNCAKAADWVRRAAEAGNPAAEYNLGLRYRDGDGVIPDPQQAATWLHKAAEHKYAKAGTALASLKR